MRDDDDDIDNGDIFFAAASLSSNELVISSTPEFGFESQCKISLVAAMDEGGINIVSQVSSEVLEMQDLSPKTENENFFEPSDSEMGIGRTLVFSPECTSVLDHNELMQ